LDRVLSRRLHDFAAPTTTAPRVIAVIRDDTDDLFETDMERLCCAGDRLILVGRPGSVSTLVTHLLG
jgi:uncharacterized protein with PhoU and TrkA domain